MDGCSKIFSIFAITKCSYMKETLLDAYRKVHFAVMAIEASAKKKNIGGKEMYFRLTSAENPSLWRSATTRCQPVSARALLTDRSPWTARAPWNA